MDFAFLPGARNTHTFQHPPDEPNHWTRAIWKRRRVRCYKYVDDGITCEKVSFENAQETPGPSRPYRLKRAIPSEGAFRSTKERAEAKGMLVNSDKTGILCISDASAYEARAFIVAADGTEIRSEAEAKMKVLGFTFSDSPGVRAHIMTIRKKFRQRFWALYNLKKNGFTEEELVQVYKSSIRPVADYLDVVYHSMLPDDLDEELDRLQNQALKIIFGQRRDGHRLGGRRLRALAGVTSLRDRRVAVSYTHLTLPTIYPV